MTRRRLIIIFLPIALTIAVAVALTWLLNTQAGARWAWSWSSAFVPGTLDAAEIHGDLRSGLNLRAVKFENKNVSVTAETLKLRLGFNLLPPAVAVESLVADRITIRKFPVLDSAPGALFSDILETLSLPVSLNFARVQIGELVYQDADGTTTFTSSALSLSGQWFDSWRIRDVTLHTSAVDWHIRGQIGLSTPFAVDAYVSGRIAPTAGPNSLPHGLDVQAHLTGNLADLEVQAELDQPAVTVRGHIRDLPHLSDWELDLLADELQWPLDSDAPQVTLHQVSAHGAGSLQHYALQAAAELGLSGLPVMSANLRGEGDTQGIRVENLQLSGDSVQLAAHGPVAWTDGLRLELASAIEQVDPGLWLAAWPNNQPLTGNLALDWQPGRLAFRSIDLKAIHTDFEVSGKGELDLAADIADAELKWKSLHWPPGAGQAEFSSELGSMQLHGKPDDWSLTGTLQLQAGQWPEGSLKLEGKGDRESLQVSIERGEVLGGVFAGQFNYRWSEQQPWSAKIDLQNLDIAPLSSAFPGVVNGAFSARGTIKPMEFDIETEQLSGVIRGQATTVSGGVSLKDGGIYARELRIQSGQSNFELDGSPHLAEGIRFSARIAALGELIEDAGGSIESTGRFAANPEHPRLELQLQGKDLSWGEWRVGAISTKQQQGPADAAFTRFELTGLSFGDRMIDAVNLGLSGQNPFDNIELEINRNGTRLEASLDGSISDWNDLSAARWNGKINSLRIHNKTLGFLQLEQAAALAIDASHLEVGPACLKGSRNGRVCFDTRWGGPDELTAHARLDAISLNLMQLFLGTHLDYSQTLTGELQWLQPRGEKPSAMARIELSPGQIAYESEDTVLTTGPGLFEFEIQDGQLLTGKLDINLRDAGSINTDFSAPDISRGIDSAIDGRIQVQLNRIEPLLQWIPSLVDHFSGSVNADVRLGGTMANPKLTGHASLVRGRYEHSASGTVITDIVLAGAVYDFDYTELYGSFKAGDGQGSIKAAVKFDNIFDPDITMELTGQNLSLVNVPDMTVNAEPDLRLHWHDNLLSLNGRIVIPSARISPRYLPSTSASESPDLVIIGGEQAAPEESYFDRSRLRLDGTVTVELGKDVTVTLERATAKLRGKVKFTWNKNLLPIADGTYTLSGKISAYGQLLEVADGRVSFPRVPANNPHLNINAEREIYGNVQIKQAGVHVTGTLKSPTLEPYTTPPTTRERALTLLVTGHDFDYEQGVGGVEVGMYIAPRLYVSYGIGLFESQSVISARYDLKNGFGIKATSGQRETGADISYTIEH